MIIGRPNVGKSSLFNRLARQRIAITSDVSGTTRDTNKTEIEIYDKTCFLIDSGGLDESSELFKNIREKRHGGQDYKRDRKNPKRSKRS